MAETRHDHNQELIGQGIANIFSPFVGGIAATGAIVLGLTAALLWAFVALIGASVTAAIPRTRPAARGWLIRAGHSLVVSFLLLVSLALIVVGTQWLA